jgi:hypothetical protein
MRVVIAEPAEPAWEAARSIAQNCWRADMALNYPLSSTVMVADFGKARVNRM